MNTKYIEEIVKLSQKAFMNNEVPVGAIVVYEGKIIGKGYNNKQKKHNVLGHAEIIAINKASKKLKDWRLNNCELYVTLEPCDMCKEVIRQSRISKIYYLIDSKFNNEKKKNIEYIKVDDNSGVSTKYLAKIKDFFDSKR